MKVNQKIIDIAKQRFGDIPKEFLLMLEQLARTEEDLIEAQKNGTVTPSSYGNVNYVKARLFDYLNSDGILIVGKVME